MNSLNENDARGESPDDTLPLRAELFSVTQMEQYGSILAGAHQLSNGRAQDQLLTRLANNETVLRNTCNLLTESVKADRQMTPAAEWLLDNFYLIEEHIHLTQKHLPKGYSKELPCLQKRASGRCPRVYDLALEIISHGDGRVEPESLSRFIAAYQQITPLKLGELWAIPIMLRLALIENLRRVAEQLAIGRVNRNLADTWADKMIETAEHAPSNLILLVADMARSKPPMTGSFVAELTRRLQGQSPALTLPLTWITQHLSETGLTIESLVQSENQQQAADQVSISNSIGSLRFLSTIDWHEFVETMSTVEQTLRKDPSAIYSQMDFATRDCYRHVIESIGRRTSCTETQIAEEVIKLANGAAATHGHDNRTAHVGFYLIDKGFKQLEKAVKCHVSPSLVLKKFAKTYPLLCYLGPIFLISALFTAGMLEVAYYYEIQRSSLVVLGILTFLASSQLAVAFVNWLATLWVAPSPLPRMNFAEGIPAEFRTLVAVPTLLTSLPGIDSLCEALEVRFLANRDKHLQFALLTDFADAASETISEDEALLQHAQKAIVHLNEKYADHSLENGSTFFLFHRPRRWNAQEKIWMGHERKRGKLADLNQLLCTGSSHIFSCVVGSLDHLSSIKYVITLDTDTQLARDSARQFVSVMAHPLNHPVYDEKTKRVTDGYGILQPRVASRLPAANASYYERLFSGDAGIDPYTRTVSDVYQDLFSEGSFIGKGIYDVEMFERVLKDRFPENRILSHDLLEGCYLRSGLLSDVQLYEEYPSRYSVDVKRRHRWIRGDWQLFAWLLPSVPANKEGTTRQKNPLSALSYWKVFDNLRRSLVSTALVALFILGWVLLPASGLWTSALLSILFIPPLSAVILDLFHKPKDVLIRQHLLATMRSTRKHFSHTLLTLAFLPHDAFFSLDAILRTVWRMLISRKQLLEWVPSSEANKSTSNQLHYSFRMMWSALAVAIATVSFIILFAPPLTLLFAVPILLLWLISPIIAWKISLPLASNTVTLSVDQTKFLHHLARKTWAFFENFVVEEDNWLPPDNMQEKPVAAVAHRTSPTNIGLALLANLSAYDFGYISIEKLLTRTRNTLTTMEKLERHQGHFYNWYDTQTLKPLHPMYVSTVDSGNLAGHLLTLRPGLSLLLDQSIAGPRLFEGMNDTFQVVLESLNDNSEFSASHPKLEHFHTLVKKALATPPSTLFDLATQLEQFVSSSLDIRTLFQSSATLPVSISWAAALHQQCHDAYKELIWLAPWSLSSSAQSLANASELDLQTIPTLRNLAKLETLLPSDVDTKLAQHITQGSQHAAELIASIESMMLQCIDFARMEYAFLYDKTTHLLAIGYNASERRRDNSFYDLLASEARLCSFVAIAQGQLPQETWFALGRQLTIAGGEPILLSWSGSMFEYLMPLLIMPNYENTLLDQTYKSAVERQIEYGKQRGIPWGISESGYYTFDASLNYQYRAFGVPGLGLKRGLGDDIVVAPYASMMALMVAPEAACINLQKLKEQGFEGTLGFYEAIDYTPARLPRGQNHVVVQSYMSHHQGMGFLSLAYLLLNRPMQKRFESDPLFQATLLLLHEKVPKATALYANTTELADIRISLDEHALPMRLLTSADTRVPETQLLSNGKYHLMITNGGGSFSRWKDLAVTRWREDTTRDHWGAFCYVRDSQTGAFWSTTYQPTLKKPDHYEVIFSEGQAEFRRRDQDIDMHTKIVVSPEDDIELRRTRITNRSSVRKTIDITSYSEVVLAPAPADSAHPAFSNLFIQTEILEQQRAIICTRRPRTLGEKMPWMLHLMAVHDSSIGEISYETDRMKFIGRGNSLAAPHAMLNSKQLSGSQGSVLDPITSIRYQITLEPEKSVIIDMVTGVADTRDDALHLIEKYQDRHLADRVLELAWTHGQVMLRQLNITNADAQVYSHLANYIFYSNALLRADASILIKNQRGQSGLWSYAISGDLPIVLLKIKSSENIDLVRQLIQAHAYWRLKGLAVDLVIWNEDHASYRQQLQDHIMGLISSSAEAQNVDRPGGIFLRLADQISSEDRILLQSVARVILSDSRGSLSEQIHRRALPELRIPPLIPTRKPALIPSSMPDLAVGNLTMFNGVGGFSHDGREYVIITTPETQTPAPWVNVLANPNFGSVVSESGQAYTWGENAHEYRLTPWNNDPVTDSSGEAFYIRDEQTGEFWSPTPLPARGRGKYVTRHGFGYSQFEHIENGIYSELCTYVALDASIKYSVLKVRNVGVNVSRKLTATGYVEWVLGELRSKSTLHVITELDPVSGVLCARNAYNNEFSNRIGFFDVDAKIRTFTGDRGEFIGRNRSLYNPAAMHRVRLSGKIGAALDACAALQVPFELAPGQEFEMVFMLGAGQSHDDVNHLIHRYRGRTAARKVLDAIHQHWQHTLGVIQIETPDPALNILANGWLMYQTIACRLWARSGYYQSGGAYGFRDQLQDVMALIYSEPHLVREHLLLCAAHQFKEGDVQHWWHPPADRGVRTLCSDDYLWLPLATTRYVLSTGDIDVLYETRAFLEGRPLNHGEDSYYDLPIHSAESATLYQHCVRAIIRGLRFGPHGLPLIGSCDWNDGMDKVGTEGRGESVWLGFFLYDVLIRFIPIAKSQGDTSFAERCENEAIQLRQNLEEHAWDGQWYRRAYFDDGTPLGSSANPECQIDSISQSWAVLSGAGNTTRTHHAMQAVYQRLVKKDYALVQLLDPPFSISDLNPGYIRGYVPGVRENGGQYTHAAIWSAMAFAKIGNSEQAWELVNMINPLNHGKTAEDIATYKVEPYVIAADVYAVSPHIGRGGWTWYTGSSGWMYRLIIESLLGLYLEGDRLTITPCLPASWPSFKLSLRHWNTMYHIEVLQENHPESNVSDSGITVDGLKQSDQVIHLQHDQQVHTIEIKVTKV
ncbi:MAG: glucoamylase family protein [Pseudomonadota bacterium]